MKCSEIPDGGIPGVQTGNWLQRRDKVTDAVSSERRFKAVNNGHRGVEGVIVCRWECEPSSDSVSVHILLYGEGVPQCTPRAVILTHCKVK